MRNHFSMLVIVVALTVCGLGRANAQSRSGQAEYERTRDATIRAFSAYREGVNKVRKAFSRKEINFVERGEEHIAVIRALDRRNVDEALLRYVDLEEQRISDFQPYIKQIQRDWDNLQAGVGLAGKMGDAVAENGFEQLLAGVLVAGMAGSAQQQFIAKWKPVMQKLQADSLKKYEPQSGNLLKYLYEKYEYPFYSLEYGGK